MSKKSKKVVDIKVGSSLTKVLFINNQLLSADEVNELSIVKINLPRKSSNFIKSSCGDIFELLQFNEKYRSWFIDDVVCSDGKIYLTTKIDPIFIFIQYLEESCKDKAQPLDQILEGSADLFSDSLKMSQMKLVADQKGPDDLKAFLYNEEKTLKWLKKKFDLTRSSLKQQRIAVSSGVASSNFVKSSLDCEELDENSINEAALGIISEYISLDLIEKLENFYGINEKSKEINNIKRKSDASHGGDVKRIKIEEQENQPEKPNATQQTPKISSKTKALEKAAKGTKSINSFFTKK